MPMPKFEYKFDLTALISLFVGILMLAVVWGGRDSTLAAMQQSDRATAEQVKELNVDQIRVKVDMADVRARLLVVEQRLSAMEKR